MKHNYFILAAIAFVIGLAFAGCKKDTPETLYPKITDDNVSVTANSATFTWTVDWVGKRISVVELSQNEDMSDSQFYGSEEELNKSDFVVTVHDLTPNTKYYYRFWVWNQSYLDNKFVMGTKNFNTSGELEVVISNVTVNSTSVTVKCNVISDGGDNVTKRGVCWSTSLNPEYSGNHLSNGSGTGSFSVDLYSLATETQYHVRAYAINSVGIAYSDDVTFTTSATPQAPTGAISGRFSVSDTKKVWFSKGNLQYRASDGRWRFAEHQYDIIGGGNSSISSTNSKFIDLFGWGTSGWNSGAVCYQPWSTSGFESDYYPGGSSTNNLTGSYANADWGVYNKIYNGGNTAGQWRTLTKDEWVYVFQSRSGADSKFGRGKVNGHYGVILLPDSWILPSGLSFTAGEYYNNNQYTLEQWALMEANGAVFLPVGGYRDRTYFSGSSYGYYWSSSYYDSDKSWRVYFNESSVIPSSYGTRDYGYSVRLVFSGN